MAVEIRNIHTNKVTRSTVSVGELLEKDITLFKKRFSDKNKEAFYLSMSTMISAGVDIVSCFELVEAEIKETHVRKLIYDIKQAVVKGRSLAQAMKASTYFSPYEYYSVQIGEETGRLGDVLQALATYYEKKLKQRRQFIGAISYPLLILLASFGAVGFMLYFIVPMFEDIFKRFGGELPYLTQIIINASAWLASYGILFFLTLIAIAIILTLNRNKFWFKYYSTSIIQKIPLFGKLFTGIYISRFAGSMALLTAARVPLIDCLKMNNKIIDFYPINAALEQMEKDIMAGRTLYESMAKFPIFDRRMLALVKIGEEINQLDKFFSKLSKQYMEETEHTTSQLNTFLEPFMIVFLGAVVGTILIAMYLPMFELSNNLH